MLRNYLTIALRHLAKHKGYTFINIFSLAVGMAACLLILLFIQHKRSFDRFHTRADRIYRLNEVQTWEGIAPQQVALSMYPMGPTMQADFPEVTGFTRFIDGGTVLRRGDAMLLVDHTFWTDPAVFELFDFPLLQGDPATALTEPGSAVLTATTAQQLFGDAEPVGQVVTVGERELTVTGVLADVPDVSHLQFDALFSLSTIENEDMLSN